MLQKGIGATENKASLWRANHLLAARMGDQKPTSHTMVANVSAPDGYAAGRLTSLPCGRLSTWGLGC